MIRASQGRSSRESAQRAFFIRLFLAERVFFIWVFQFEDGFSFDVGVEAEGYFGGNYHGISRR